MLPSPSSSHHRKITHFLSVWNSGHLDFVFTTVVRVVRKGFCRSLDGHGGFGPEKATLCSDIIQNPGERVTILVPRRHAPFLIISPQEDHLLFERLEFGAFGPHPRHSCRGCREGVLLQPGWV